MWADMGGSTMTKRDARLAHSRRTIVRRCPQSTVRLPSHGGNTGSNPVGDASFLNHLNAQSRGRVQNLSHIRAQIAMDNLGRERTGSKDESRSPPLVPVVRQADARLDE